VSIEEWVIAVSLVFSAVAAVLGLVNRGLKAVNRVIDEHEATAAMWQHKALRTAEQRDSVRASLIESEVRARWLEQALEKIADHAEERADYVLLGKVVGAISGKRAPDTGDLREYLARRRQRRVS